MATATDWNALEERIKKILEDSDYQGCRCYSETSETLDKVTDKVKQVFIEFLQIEDRGIQQEVDELLGESQE